MRGKNETLEYREEQKRIIEKRKVKSYKKLSEEKQNAFRALCELFLNNNKKYRRLMSMKKRF